MKVAFRAAFPAEGIMNSYTYMIDHLNKSEDPNIAPCCPGLGLEIIKESHFSSRYIFSSSPKYDLKVDITSNTYPTITIVNKTTDTQYIIDLSDLINLYQCTLFEIHVF